MSKSIVLLLVLAFLTASCLIVVKPGFSISAVATENTWTQKAPMQVARYGFGVAVVNGKIYAIGGGPSITNSVEEYDPENDTWTYKAPMPTPRYYFAIAVYQNKIYCIGGSRDYSPTEGDTLTTANEVYDPTTDTWENKTAMPLAKLSGPANVVNGKIYLIGGLPNNTLNQVYDPVTDTWTTKAPMPTEPAGPSGVIDNKIYVIGSYFESRGSLDFGYVSRTQIYDTNTDSWSLGSAPPEDFFVGSVGVTAGFMAPKRIYVLSGSANQVYDPEADSWTVGAAVPTSRGGFAVAVVDDLIYVIGGVTVSYEGRPLGAGGAVAYYATVEAYTPFGYGTVPPIIDVASPENVNYTSSEVQLNFTVNRHVEWMRYSLDGNENVTVTGNITLTGLSNGFHNITVYAKDTFENTGASETIIFTIAEEPEPFPTTLVAVILVSVAIVGAGLLVYFVKFKKQQRKQLPSKQQKG